MCEWNRTADPLFFVFPGMRKMDTLWSYFRRDRTVSDSVWSNTQIFTMYMQTHLIKYLPPRTEEAPVLLSYDSLTNKVRNKETNE